MALSEERYLKPADILFTQDSISAKFQNGARIRDVLQALLDKRIKVSDIPLMRIVKNFNKWWSFDNRRLWLFREMASRGRCEEVKVRIIPFDEDEWEKKYTTKNGGKSVHIRGDKMAAPKMLFEFYDVDSDFDDDEGSDSDSDEDGNGDEDSDEEDISESSDGDVVGVLWLLA